MKEKTAFLVVWHGSRLESATREFEQVVDMVASREKDCIVQGAHMELADPDIPTAIGILADKGAQLVVVIPYFLHAGRHSQIDIPAMVKAEALNYPGLQFLFAKPIGVDPLMADIVLKRGREVKGGEF